MAKVDTVKDAKTGFEVPIHLNKKTLKFSAAFADFKVENSDGEQVRRDVLEAIRQRAELVWLPIIYVWQQTNPGYVYRNGQELPQDERETMGLDIMRFYVAKRLDGTGGWMRVGWDIPAQNRLDKATHWSDFSGDTIQYSSTSNLSETWGSGRRKIDTFILPYDADLWSGLHTIIDKMKQIRETVTGLLNSQDGINRLIAASSDVPLLK